MLLPNLSQLLSFSSSSSTAAVLFGGQTAQNVGSLFGGLGAGAESLGAEGNLFSGLLDDILGDMGLNTSANITETLAAAKNQEKATEAEGAEQAERAELALLQVTQIVTVVYEEFSLLQASDAHFDDLNSAEALSAAYQQLGMSAEEADSRAARLTIMFMMLDDRLTTADLIGSLDGQLGSQPIAATQQRAFIKIEQTIQAFSIASTGSHGQLSSLLEKGQGLLSGVALTSLRGAEGQAIIENLGVTPSGQAAAPTLEGGLFGRVNEIFNRLANKAAEHPEGQQLAAQLQQIATATQNISNQVVQDGGLVSLQNTSLQKATLELTPQSAPQQAIAAEIAAEISENQALPSAERARDVAAEGANLGRSANERATDKTADTSNRQANGVGSKPPALPEPAVPSYVVRPSAEGGVEVVDPQTGQVLQTSTATTSQTSPQAGEATLAQSRGLETAQQVRLAQQVRVHVRTLAGHNGGQIVVGLNPKELGRVQVRLEITEGTVRGAITVQRADVAEAISRDIRALEQALQDVGLELAKEGIAIQLENHAAGSNGSKNEAEQQTGTAFASTNKEAQTFDAESEKGGSRWVSPDRLLDVDA